MSTPLPRDAIYRRRRFSPETIELCVRWYLTYRLSYRDLAAMLADREIHLSHTTILRWVQRYVPEYERRWARFARSPGTSWRMDETAVAVRGGRHYLYRAVDKQGQSVASLLCTDRNRTSAQGFFEFAVRQPHVPWPQKINLDGNSATHLALQMLGHADRRWRGVEVRSRRYLNNVVEQDHRAIQQRCAPMLGLKSTATAAVTLAGIELAHRIRKGQYALPLEEREQPSLKDKWAAALARAGDSDVRDSEPSPPMHQNSGEYSWSARRAGRSMPGAVRYAHKIAFGDSLILFVRPAGGRSWHYDYRYAGKRRTLVLGKYPEVPVVRARSRHAAARRLLAAGIDPSLRRFELWRDGWQLPGARES